MKKILLSTAVMLSNTLFVSQAAAGFVEFKPQNAQFVSPKQTQQQPVKPVAPKVSIKPAAVGNSALNDTYLRNLVTDQVNKLIAQGVLKGDKGERGEPGGSVLGASVNNFDPDVVGFQTAYIPGAYVGPDVGTVFASTNLSSDALTSNTASFNSLDLTGDLSSEGSISVAGGASFADTSISALSVGTITSESGAYLSEGGDWVNASSRERKENLATTSGQSILDKIAGLPIYVWNYKNQNPSIAHIGPMAEDFYEKFGFGNSSTSISTIDPSGVALAGIQGLNEKIKSLLDFSWILEGFKQLGIEIEKSIIRVKALAAESISTKALEVGSPNAPEGITIYDRATKQPFCVFVENGSMKNEFGKCGEVGNAEVAPSADIAAPAVIDSSSIAVEQEVANTDEIIVDQTNAADEEVISEETPVIHIDDGLPETIQNN